MGGFLQFDCAGFAGVDPNRLPPVFADPVVLVVAPNSDVEGAAAGAAEAELPGPKSPPPVPAVLEVPKRLVPPVVPPPNTEPPVVVGVVVVAPPRGGALARPPVLVPVVGAVPNMLLPAGFAVRMVSF